MAPQALSEALAQSGVNPAAPAGTPAQAPAPAADSDLAPIADDVLRQLDPNTILVERMASWIFTAIVGVFLLIQLIVNLFGAIPIIGEDLSIWIRGDYVVSDATLNRFFALHVIALPLVLLAGQPDPERARTILTSGAASQRADAEVLGTDPLTDTAAAVMRVAAVTTIRRERAGRSPSERASSSPSRSTSRCRACSSSTTPDSRT